MTVPETTVNKANCSKPAKDQIRRTREFAVVETIPESTCVQGTTKEQFGLGVFPTYFCHHSRPNCLINYIGHVPVRIAREIWSRISILQNLIETFHVFRAIASWLSLTGARVREVVGILVQSRYAGQRKFRTNLQCLFECNSPRLGEASFGWR